MININKSIVDTLEILTDKNILTWEDIGDLKGNEFLSRYKNYEIVVMEGSGLRINGIFICCEVDKLVCKLFDKIIRPRIARLHTKEFKFKQNLLKSLEKEV